MGDTMADSTDWEVGEDILHLHSLTDGFVAYDFNIINKDFQTGKISIFFV
jgi:hypothetical protein